MGTEPPNPDFRSQPAHIGLHADTHLQNLAVLLTGRYRVSRITCFGIRHRRRESFLLTDPARTGNHYFILVETRELYTESAIQDYANNRFTGGKVFVLAHHHGKVLEMLEAGHRFYFQVRRSGILLFTDQPDPDTRKFPWPDDWMQQAERHFKIHFGMARSFLDGAGAQLEAGQLRTGLFLLHQTMEQACIGLIRVFLGYRANFHNLGRLLELCSCFIRRSAGLFPGDTSEDRRRFQILCRSYTEARYREEFTVKADDCRDILQAVAAFIRQTEDCCRTRLPLSERSWGSLGTACCDTIKAGSVRN